MNGRGQRSSVALAFMPRSLRAELYTILAEGGSADEVLERARRLDRTMSWLPDPRSLDRHVSALESAGGALLLAGDKDYPPLLRDIYDPPMCLFVRGRLPASDQTAVAIVGSRASVGNSVSFAMDLARSLAKAGVAVVSGMARGIDGAAHAGCLEGGARTVAVLGSGADVCYPRDNRALMEKILMAGAIVSEYPMGTAPTAYRFPARNRIISGWCRGTVVVEAAIGSGALLTAKCASEQGRIVFAVPGAVWNPLSEGPNDLIRDGAVPVRGADDVIEELFGVAPRGKARCKERGDRLTGAERSVLSALDYDMPRHVDTVAGLARVSATRALALLLELEMKGFAGQLMGKRFLRISRVG